MSQITEGVLAVLSTLEIEGSTVRITEQLDRKLYLAVNDVLMRIGGKWNRKSKAHLFSADPTDLLNTVIESGMLDPKVKTGYFPTPSPIVEQMIDLADVSDNTWILEPSAGQGHIADKICEVTGTNPLNIFVCEVLSENIKILQSKGYTVRGDFLDFANSPIGSTWRFDRIVMNPPFAPPTQADITHVTAAFNLLAPGGKLVTIMSAGVLFRGNKKTVEFRENIMEPFGTYLVRLPDGAFKASGTLVNTILLRLEKEI